MKKKIICTICVRGGSKGVKNKNIRPLNGEPLINHTIKQVQATGLFDCVVVSSDSDEILAVAKNQGVDFLIKRPEELANDTAAKMPAIQHCVQAVEEQLGVSFDIVVDLSATSPLRFESDIVQCVELLEQTGANNIITAAPANRSPYFNLVELDENGIVKLCKPPQSTLVRRQDSPLCFDMNASIYVWTKEQFWKTGDDIFNSSTRMYEMPQERSIDIDTLLDFEIVEMVMKKRAGVNNDKL